MVRAYEFIREADIQGNDGANGHQSPLATAPNPRQSIKRRAMRKIETLAIEETSQFNRKDK